MRIIIRLTPEVDEFFRFTPDSIKRGALSARLAEVVESVEWKRVQVTGTRQASGTTVEQTAVVISASHFRILRREAALRGCSVNLILNAAIAHYEKQRKGQGWVDAWD